jgi:GNAT superfamily N-acetyltransferase
LSNTPDFLAPRDRDDFLAFADDLPGPYWVIDGSRAIVACGGWAMEADGVAALTWGMVERRFHRRGIGRDLLRFRLEAIRVDGRAKVARVRTVQLVQGFFEQQGFVVIDVASNGFGAGLDRVTIELRLEAVV